MDLNVSVSVLEGGGGRREEGEGGWLAMCTLFLPTMHSHNTHLFCSSHRPRLVQVHSASHSTVADNTSIRHIGLGRKREKIRKY